MDPNLDMDVYLRTFERTCRQFHLPRDQWARYLTPGLKGKALEVFADLPMDCDGDYDKIKEALIKRYNLTPEVYRKRFRTVQRAQHDSYADVLSNLRTAFNQWVRGLSISTFADLADLMIKDQLLHICSAEVRQFILTKEPKTSDQAADFADLYVASRVQDVRRSPPPLRKEGKTRDHPPSSADRMSPRSGPNTSGRQAVAIDDRRCYVCKKTGHLSNSCPEKMIPNPHEKSTASHAVLWVSAQIPHPVDNLQPVTVSNQLATGLRDSGAEITLVHPKLISQKDIIPDKTLTVTGIGGRNPTLAMARVYLDWGAGCGMREVGVSASLPADVLLGTDLGRMIAHYVPATTSTDTSAPPVDQMCAEVTSDALSSELDGKRIICDGEYGTVRFVSTVPPTPGLWLGIEWDNPSRGKHDGCHNGTRYFVCRHPTGGSFIRPKKANFGVSFLTAMNKRYGTNRDWNNETLLIGKKTVECIGFESVQEEQSQLNTLSDISLRECEVSNAGQQDEIIQTCPNISILNLSKNLLSSWESVADIARQLKKLTSLDLSENQLSLPTLPASLANAFENLTSLSLSRTGITWNEVLQCSVMWPVLEELHLAGNDIAVLERPVNCLQSITLLNISNNNIDDGNQLHAIAGLPRLKQLIVLNNRISKVEFPVTQFGCETEFFSTLNSLSIDNNVISKWSFINELNKLKSLQSLNCLGNPLMDSEKNPETVRQLIIAKIAKLKYLNKTEILPEERKGAELDYRKMFGMDWLKAGGNQKTELNNPSMEFLEEHPRYCDLIKKFGAPDDGEIKPVQPVTLKSQLLSLTIKCPDKPDHKAIKKSLPDSMTVQKVKGLLYRLLKVPGSELKLSYESSKMEGKEIELENDLKPLQFYSVENGDSVLVRW
ncbi:tubulin-specific chaperone E [Gastrophryne carolinensis]